MRVEAAEKEAARVALEQQADTALAQARNAQARATALQQQLAQAQRRFYVTLVAGALVLLAVVLIAWRFARRRRLELAESEAARRATDEQLAAAVTPAPFSCLLEGTDPDGRRVVIKIGAEQLGTRRYRRRAQSRAGGRRPRPSGGVA